MTRGTAAVWAAKRASTTIPIVFVSGSDPARAGLVASLARPGGNMTGLSLMLSESRPKRLELLKEAVPRLSRVALLGPPGWPWTGDFEAVARALRLRLSVVDARGVTSWLGHSRR